MKQEPGHNILVAGSAPSSRRWWPIARRRAPPGGVSGRAGGESGCSPTTVIPRCVWTTSRRPPAASCYSSTPGRDRHAGRAMTPARGQSTPAGRSGTSSAYSPWWSMNWATYQHRAMTRRPLARTSSSAYLTSSAARAAASKISVDERVREDDSALALGELRHAGQAAVEVDLVALLPVVPPDLGAHRTCVPPPDVLHPVGTGVRPADPRAASR